MERIDQELDLLRKYYPELKVDSEKKWVWLPGYVLPTGMKWNKTSMDICIEIKVGYPGTLPYGIYVPNDLRFDGNEPLNWQATAANMPSFAGDWAMISWTPEDGHWIPSSDIVKGSNLLNFVKTFADRFKEGR